MKRPACAMAALLWPLVLFCSSAEPVEFSIKLVKTRPVRASVPPRIEFSGGAGAWRLVDKPYHSGENDWEVYFEAETDAVPVNLPEFVIVAPGLKAARVIVGKTDVAFRQDAERVRFQLVDDRARGQEMRVHYRSPRGGHPIDFLHNWRMRRAGSYAGNPYPEKALAAIPNYLLAAHEVLRLMGDMSPEAVKKFKGDIVLMGSEIATTRGHLDYPPHLHIMHYQFENRPDGARDWVSRLVPHFYMDQEGRIIRNSYAVLAGRGKSGELGPGQVCGFEDTTGVPIMDLIIAERGLLLRRPDGEVYSLRPDARLGAAHAVYGFRGESAVCKAEAHDDPEKGIFKYQIDTIRNGKTVGSFKDGYHYDPFTAKVIGSAERPAAGRAGRR